MTTTAAAPSLNSALATKCSKSLRILMMDAANLDAAQEHLARRIGLGKCRRHAQPVHRAVTAHETDVRPRDVATQVEPFDQSDVDARCAEAAARDGDQV